MTILDTGGDAEHVLDGRRLPLGEDEKDNAVVYIGRTGDLLVGRTTWKAESRGYPPGYLIRVDPQTEEGRRVPFEMPDGARPIAPRPVASDATGGHLLLVPYGGLSGPVVRWSQGQEAPLADAVYDADW